MNIVEIAEKAEAHIHETFADNPFDVPQAQMYGVSVSKDEVRVGYILGCPDVYEMLAQPLRATKSVFDYIAILTTGWAAPLNKDGTVSNKLPSKHKDRRRVRLMVIANREEVVNILRFQDEPDETIVDAGTARGTLAEAVIDFMKM